MPVETTDKYVRVRVKDPNLFVDTSFRTINISEKDGIKAIIGKLKSNPNGATIVQSYLFDKEKWSESEAKKWVEEHEKSFEWVFGSNLDINLGSDTVKEIKPVWKSFTAEVKDFNDEHRSFTAIASTESQDRMGDILRASGWQLKNYLKNPIVLWGHRSDLLPIGKAKRVWVEGDKLMFEPEFASKEINPFADQVYQMYKNGFLKSFSVRFDPIEWQEIKEKKGDMNYFVGYDYLKHDLLEISAVNVPANPDAIKEKNFQNMVLKSYALENITDNNELLEKIMKGEYDFEKENAKEFVTKMDLIQKELDTIKAENEILKKENSELKEVEDALKELENELNNKPKSDIDKLVESTEEILKKL